MTSGVLAIHMTCSFGLPSKAIFKLLSAQKPHATIQKVEITP